MRNLIDVIEQIQFVVPTEMVYLHRALLDLQARVKLSPAELQILRWQELADLVGAACGLPEPVEKAWAIRMLALFLGESEELVQRKWGPQDQSRQNTLSQEPSNWVKLEEVLAVLQEARQGRWQWYRNPRCKYIEVRIDTRFLHCQIRDREGKPISLAQLQLQMSD